MNLQATMLKEYLKDQHPKKFKEMKATGELEAFCEARADAALKQKDVLMSHGLMDHEADEIIRSEMFSL